MQNPLVKTVTITSLAELRYDVNVITLDLTVGYVYQLKFCNFNNVLNDSQTSYVQIKFCQVMDKTCTGGYWQVRIKFIEENDFNGRKLCHR